MACVYPSEADPAPAFPSVPKLPHRFPPLRSPENRRFPSLLSGSGNDGSLARHLQQSLCTWCSPLLTFRYSHSYLFSFHYTQNCRFVKKKEDFSVLPRANAVFCPYAVTDFLTLLFFFVCDGRLYGRHHNIWNIFCTFFCEIDHGIK